MSRDDSLALATVVLVCLLALLSGVFLVAR